MLIFHQLAVVASILGAAHGAPPAICAYAADAIGDHWGWRSGTGGPVTPLGAQPNQWMIERVGADAVHMLVDSLASDDPCVREMSVRLIGRT
jgi:hypothetical protein